MKTFPNDFIEEVRKKLDFEKERLSISLKNLSQDDPFLDPERLNDNAAVDTEAKEEVDHERIEVLKQGVEGDISAIDTALEKINKGTYGVCENCNQMISIERLTAVPTARYCMDCEKKLSKKVNS